MGGVRLGSEGDASALGVCAGQMALGPEHAHHCQLSEGSRAKACGVASCMKSCRRQSPPAPRYVAMPDAAETPAPHSAFTCLAWLRKALNDCMSVEGAIPRVVPSASGERDATSRMQAWTEDASRRASQAAVTNGATQ